MFITEEDGETVVPLVIDKNVYDMELIPFSGDVDTGVVQARLVQDADSQKYIFTSSNLEEFLWLGDVRNDRAGRDLAELANSLLRLGIKDSEYLRLAGKRKKFF